MAEFLQPSERPVYIRTGQPLLEYMKETCGFIDIRPLPNGWYAAVHTLTYGRARIVVGFDGFGYEDSW